MLAASTSSVSSCESYVLNELVEVPAVTDNEVYGTHHFWVFLLLMIFCWVGQAVTGVMADAICFELLGNQRTPAKDSTFPFDLQTTAPTGTDGRGSTVP